jgi:magnesium chelatase subunit D
VSLRLPVARARPATAQRGPIIGVERTVTLRDLALVSTILAAAKFQPVRRAAHPEAGPRLLLSASDLRRYRRAPVARELLVLLLDYTCLGGCRWLEALVPYLRWAYVERAAVSVIQVGARDAGGPLEAAQVTGQSLLAPRVLAALDAPPGDATPLAHGLDVARQTLKRALEQRRGTLRPLHFVVLSDGRGNVPLQASRDGRWPAGPVGRGGVDDALQVAQALRGLRPVRVTFLNPQPRYYAELPLELAEALGASVVAVPRDAEESLACPS